MRTYDQSRSQGLESSLSSNYKSRHSGSGLGNNSMTKEKVNLVSDVQSWLDLQLSMISNLNPDQRNERVNGVLHTVKMVDRAFKGGDDFNVSKLPHAPSSQDKPELMGMLPEFRQSVTHFNMGLSIQSQRQATIASLTGGFDNGGMEVDRPLLLASAANSGVDPGVQALATRVSGLKLRLPDEGGSRFSVAAYGDFSSIVLIMKECIAMGIRSPDQVAYILATAWLESRMGNWMTESAWLSKASAERHGELEYGPNGRRPEARSLGNTNPGDGSKYMGRGYVQLTWKDNYARMSKLLQDSGYQYTYKGVTYGNGQNGTKPIDLVTNYNHVSDNKELAARILVFGMDGGHYTQSGGLDTYLPEGRPSSHGDFQNARKIVNGADKKKLIADNAVSITNVLRNGDAWVKLFSQ